MADIAERLSDQDQLGALAQRLIESVSAVRLSAGEISIVRWELCRHLLAQLSDEDEMLYPGVRPGGTMRVRQASSALPQDAAGFSEWLRAYMAMWTPDRIRQDSVGFCSDTIRILAALLRRIERESRIDALSLAEPSATSPGRIRLG
ncbi:hypothetical protein CLG96_04440 [Sphingomonas oleivorans]|uniref:Uncharacterized protein n=1 Tax=Sphingomonas oleivorans TaxID=1735121 RepID=A0A2T5G2H2_9SPHN|nr:hypothetical protein [Sphingomonas oleivorans]PTQ13352.1 hypothetical protein CLG96_04440 [Sphingomonas oleivorans]